MPALKELTVFIKETRQGHNSHDIKISLFHKRGAQGVNYVKKGMKYRKYHLT